MSDDKAWNDFLAGLPTEEERRSITKLCRLLQQEPVRPPATKASRRRRKPRISTMIAQAEKAGKNVASVTTPDGVTLTFGEPPPTEASNIWLRDIDKATKQ